MSEAESQLPTNWRRWDREAQIEYLTLGRTRLDILDDLRDEIDSDRESPRLNKSEVAMVALNLGVYV